MLEDSILQSIRSSLSSVNGAVSGLDTSMRSSIQIGGLSVGASGSQSASIRVDDAAVTIGADFIGNGQTDQLRLDWVTRATQLTVVNPDQTRVTIDLPSVPAGWDLRTLSDIDNNGILDLSWTNNQTGETNTWLATGNVNAPFTYQRSTQPVVSESARVEETKRWINDFWSRFGLTKTY
jgi:hypothetical protein